MYIKTPNTYPYSFGQLLADNPDTSFPDSMPDERLAEWGVFPVQPTTQPSTQPSEVIEEVLPVEQGGQWVQQWLVRPATADETNNQATQVRAQRNQLLADSDWTQLADAPVNSLEWANYRQALRDITLQAGFPWEVQWPEKP